MPIILTLERNMDTFAEEAPSEETAGGRPCEGTAMESRRRMEKEKQKKVKDEKEANQGTCNRQYH